MFRILIIGGDNTDDYLYFQNRCAFYLQNKAKQREHIVVLSTGDEFVKKFTEKYHIDCEVFNCDWNTYGKNALKVRNDKILTNIDAVLYFKDNNTSNQILYDTAKGKGINCRTVECG